MNWPSLWPTGLLALLIVALDSPWSTPALASPGPGPASWTSGRKLDVRERVRELWHHGYDHYMDSGRGPNWLNPGDFARNDVAGNFSVTLVDVLDTFVVLNDPPGFEDAVRKIIRWVSFDSNTKPQVFETTIRVMGGLLSGHLFANKPEQPFYLPWYQGELLQLAYDLGVRLLPAFNTVTGLPYARINLRHGVPKGESTDTCTAGAGSLILEFGTLSRLTGDDRFEKAAYKAFFALWNRRSDIGLVGNTINIFTGSWTHPEVNNIGAGIDSFYEYALKWYIMSGEVEFLDVWQDSYASVMRYSRAPDGFWYRNVNIHSGDAQYGTIDSLSAFWSGLQVLGGDIENAVKSHLIYYNIWRGFAGLPEVWDMNYHQATSFQYPLRPEFVESTWYLYRATGDTFYLDIGERILHDITIRSRAECGLTGISDLRTNTRDDRMESFVLSETLKYLFLLFDEANPLHADDTQWVFTTEGHILTLDPALLRPISPARRKLRRVENLQCPAYAPPMLAYDAPEDYTRDTGLVGGVMSRVDFEYARNLIGRVHSENETRWWDPDGWCALPKHEPYTYDFVLSAHGEVVLEDPRLPADKITEVADGYLVQNVTGIRVHIVSRLDGKGYDIAKLGPYAVKTGQKIYFNDTQLSLTPVDGQGASTQQHRRIPEIELRFFLDYVDPLLQLQAPGMHDVITETVVPAATAMFAGDPAAPRADDGTHPLRFGHGAGVRLIYSPTNPLGCAPYTEELDDAAVLVARGECTFLEKLVFAQRAGASGVVVLGNEDQHINPSVDLAELEAAGPEINDVAIVVLRRPDAQLVAEMLDSAERHGLGDIRMVVETWDDGPQHRSEPTKTAGKLEDTQRVLYLNNHPLLNTRLLV
ncbi:alpha-mannosidase [Trametes versicolor FP-101664 SS1]|uniref:alpha-mannosidase n=1 Tax=Trametes versicolor (strain FP-101664) TaxID=717944 RepID=UPI0004621A53|nr:alpha-mannosidase [Trametes versicolor FP-101664 SS1]EIW61741.1 alpha-mannosidase [Trametes versicolor FP-101664 SS1]